MKRDLLRTTPPSLTTGVSVIKKILGVLAMLCLTWTTVWAADFSIRDGDFKSFHLRESRDTTLARFNALVHKGDIWNEDADRDGNLQFTTQVAKDVYVGELYFQHKQLVRIDLIQRDGYKKSEKQALRSYIDKRLIRSVSKTYGKPDKVFEFPMLSTLTDEPYALAEWMKWRNRIVVYFVREKNRYFAGVALEAVDELSGSSDEDS